MAFPVIPVGGAVLGGLKSLFDFGRAKRQANIQAGTTAYSPWTHMQAKEPDAVNPIGDIAQGASSGLALDQNIKANDLWSQLMKKKYGIVPPQDELEVGP